MKFKNLGIRVFLEKKLRTSKVQIVTSSSNSFLVTFEVVVYNKIDILRYTGVTVFSSQCVIFGHYLTLHMLSAG